MKSGNMNASALTTIAILLPELWGFTLSVYIGHTHLLYINMQSINAVHDQCLLGWTNLKQSKEKRTDALFVNVISSEHCFVDFGR